MKKGIQILLISILAAAVIGIAVLIQIGNNTTTAAAVSTAQMTTMELEHTIYANGTIQSLNIQSYYGSAEERVASVSVREGDRVQIGETLVQLDNGQLITSKVRGVVIECNATETGPAYFADKPLVSVASTDDLIASVPLDKDDLQHIELGFFAAVKSNGNEYNGTLTRLSGNARPGESDNGALVYADIELSNANDKLYLNYDVEVEITIQTISNTLCVPLDAVLEDAGGKYCYRVVGDTAVKTYVVYSQDPVAASKEYLQVLYNGEDGDSVIMHPTSDIYDGLIIEAVS